MTKPLTVLKTVEDVDNTPDGTVVETTSGAVFAIVSPSGKDYVKRRLPARVLRWGEDLYPTVFERVLKSLAKMKPAERENCHMAQCHVIGHSEPFVLFRIDDGERTAQDFRDAPEGTVAIDSYSGNRGLAMKHETGLWDYETNDYTEFELAEMDVVTPFTVIAVAES